LGKSLFRTAQPAGVAQIGMGHGGNDKDFTFEGRSSEANDEL